MRSLGVDVTIENVSKKFAVRDGTVHAVKDVSLTIRPGEFVSLVGPSGCGKSTILNMAAGLMKPDGGSLKIGGASVTGPIDELGVVFQRDLLLEWRTVIDNVLLPIEIKKLHKNGEKGKNDYRQRAYDLLRLVGLSEFANRYPHELSGGMRHRVSICRALIHRPKLLLMDEPFAALDAMTREQLGEDLLKMHAEDRPTVIFITHSIDEAVFLSDRVVLLSPRPAQIVETFEIDLPRPRTVDTRADEAFLAAVAKVRKGLALS